MHANLHAVLNEQCGEPELTSAMHASLHAVLVEQCGEPELTSEMHASLHAVLVEQCGEPASCSPPLQPRSGSGSRSMEWLVIHETFMLPEQGSCNVPWKPVWGDCDPKRLGC